MIFTFSITIFTVLSKPIGGTLQEARGAISMMDDILVFGNNQEEHEKNLEAMLLELMKQV